MQLSHWLVLVELDRKPGTHSQLFCALLGCEYASLHWKQAEALPWAQPRPNSEGTQQHSHWSVLPVQLRLLEVCGGLEAYSPSRHSQPLWPPAGDEFDAVHWKHAVAFPLAQPWPRAAHALDVNERLRHASWYLCSSDQLLSSACWSRRSQGGTRSPRSRQLAENQPDPRTEDTQTSCYGYSPAVLQRCNEPWRL